MIKSYFKIAVRNFTRNIGFSLINLIGLSIAFALFILLSLYIKSELTTDKHIKNIEKELNDLRNFSNQEIADKLFISLNTVKTHAKNIHLKLDVDSRTKAVAKAKDLGLL